MKSKTPLTLLELLVMILIFSITAALCVQVFVTADRWSRENALRDQAILSVQTVAERVKVMEGELPEENWTILFDAEGQPVAKSEEAVYDVTVEKTSSGHPLLGTAVVKATAFNENEELFRITVAWQEVERND